jgi:hypothetical protein
VELMILCYTFAKHLSSACRGHFFIGPFGELLYNYQSKMKFRKRDKQVGVRLRAEQHAALKEIAEREGYDSVSEFVRNLLENAIKQQRSKSSAKTAKR